MTDLNTAEREAMEQAWESEGNSPFRPEGKVTQESQLVRRCYRDGWLAAREYYSDLMSNEGRKALHSLCLTARQALSRME